MDIIPHVEHHLYDSQLIGLIESFLELIHLNRFIVTQILINQGLFLLSGNLVKTRNLSLGITLNFNFSIQQIPKKRLIVKIIRTVLGIKDLPDHIVLKETESFVLRINDNRSSPFIPTIMQVFLLSFASFCTNKS